VRWLILFLLFLQFVCKYKSKRTIEIGPRRAKVIVKIANKETQKNQYWRKRSPQHETASFQFERSQLRVTGRNNFQNLASSLLTGGSAGESSAADADCTLGLRHC